METLNDVIDPQRLIRALRVTIATHDANGDALPEWHYRATTGDTYYVQTAPHLSCDCPDHVMRSKVCKHIIAALMQEGDPHVTKLMKRFGIA